MLKKKPTTEDSSKVPSPSTVLLLFGTVADTTWRLFVPTLLGVILGLIADNYFASKPWFIIIGVVSGSLLAFGLIYLQMKGIKK